MRKSLRALARGRKATAVRTAVLAALLLTTQQALAADTAAEAALLERARMWAARNRPDLAREALQRLARIAPEHPSAIALQIELDIRAGAIAAARAALYRLRTRDPSHPELARLEDLLRLEGPDKDRLREARVLAKGGRNEAAVALLDSIYPNGPPSAELALEYWQLVAATPNGSAAALEGLTRLVQQQPDLPRYRFALAKHQLARNPLDLPALRFVIEMSRQPDLGREAKSAWRSALLRQAPHAQSVELLREYLTIDAGDSAVRERLAELAPPPAPQPTPEPAAGAGAAALERGDHASETLLESSVASRPDADSLGALGSLRLRQGRYAQAQSLFERAAQLDPARGERWRGMSRNAQLQGALNGSADALERGDAREAERLAMSALRVNPQQPDALLALGRAQAAQGALPAAMASVQAALRYEPTHAGAFRALASMYVEGGDRAGLDRLSAELTPAQQRAFAGVLAGAQRDLLRDEAKRLAAAGSSDDAMAALQRAIEFSPSDPWLRYDLAKLHAERGERERGRELLSELTRAPKPDPDALYALAMFESQQGDDAAALRALGSIEPSERSASMARTEQRLRVRSQLRQAEDAARGGRAPEAANLLRDAEAAAAGNIELALNVANAWADAGDPEHARQLAGQLPWTPDTPAASRLRHAALLRRTGDFDALHELFDTIAAAPALGEPERQDLRELRDAWALHSARRLRAEGRTQAALETLRERGNDPPVSAEVLIAHAELLLASMPSFALLPHDPQAPLPGPDDGNAHHARLTALARPDERAKAQQRIDKLLREKVETAAAELDERVELAAKLVELGQLDNARATLDTVLAAAPSHVRAWRVMARVDSRQGNRERAIECLWRAAAAEYAARSASGEARPISRLAVLDAPAAEGAPPALQVTLADERSAEIESRAWRPYRPLSEWLDQESTWWAGALDWSQRSGSDGRSTLDAKELPIEYSFPRGAGRVVLRADAVQLDAGEIALDRPRDTRLFGSLLLCQPSCPGAVFGQQASGLALNAGYEQGSLRVDLGTTPLGFRVVRPVGGIRFKGDLGAGSYSVDLSSRPLTSSLLSYAGTRDPRTGQVWGGVQASGVRLGLSRDEGLALGVWSSFQLHTLHGRNVQSNLRKRAMGGVYWRVVNDDNRVLSVGVNARVSKMTHNAGEYTFGHGGYYSPQSYRSLSLPVSFAEQHGRWTWSLRGSISRSRSRTDSAAFYPTDAAAQAAAQALTPVNGIDPRYEGSSGRGRGHSLAAALEAQLSPRLFFGARFEIDRSEDYSPNRAVVYLRFAPGGAAMRSPAFPPEPVIPTSEY